MYRLLNRNFSTGKVLIKNCDLHICVNCLHFIKPTMKDTNNYDDPLAYELYGRCKKFGKMNLITGEIEYDISRHSRLNVERCGYTGTEYTKKTKS